MHHFKSLSSNKNIVIIIKSICKFTKISLFHNFFFFSYFEEHLLLLCQLLLIKATYNSTINPFSLPVNLFSYLYVLKFSWRKRDFKNINTNLQKTFPYDKFIRTRCYVQTVCNIKPKPWSQISGPGTWILFHCVSKGPNSPLKF